MSDRTVEIRDRLNAMIEEVLREDDMDSHVVACCLAVAVEEIEKWMYKNEFTPSVIPVDAETSGWFTMPSGTDDEEEWCGPPWARRRKTVNERFPTLAAIKKRGGVKKTVAVDLTKYDISEWSEWEKRAFMKGDRATFIRAVSHVAKVGMKEAMAYADIAIEEYSDVWGK